MAEKMTLEQVRDWHATCAVIYERSGESSLADQHRNLAAALTAHLTQPAQAVDVDGRSAKDYAIEHADYLATAVRDLLHELDEDGVALDQHERNPTEETLESLEAAQESVSQARGAVRLCLHEFEKRRNHALAGDKMENK